MRRAVLPLVLLLACVPGGNVWAQSSSSAQDHRDRPTLKILGFSNFTFYASDEEDAATTSGFKEGQFVLHFASALAPSFSVFAETTLTVRETETTADIERIIVKYSYDDPFKLAFGRFHTPINWWNTAFHHGLWLQTTVTRPAMIRFGGEFLPVHFVGVFADGLIPSGPVNLQYDAGFGNGRGDPLTSANGAGDVNNNRAVLLKLSAKPNHPFGMQVGGAVETDKISEERLTQDYDERIASVYVVFTRETPEVLAEYAHVRHEGVDTGEAYNNDGYYVQAAYRLPVWHDRVKPYARYERLEVDEDDPVWLTQMDEEIFLVGVRLDVTTFMATKVEGRKEKYGDAPAFHAVYVDASFAF